jgi:polyphosphate glucokinase
VRAANDADLAALGVVQGVGVELCITLGTGVGSGLCVDGRLVPNVEIGHAPWRTGQSYEDLLGDAGRREIGNKAWSRLLMSAVTEWRRLFNPCALYLGGGNAKKIKVELPNGVQRVDNTAGLVGGVALWRHRRE